ncbi:4193_t:CDS:2 [Scutellospora calospora]|uniref:4193_t:CDS:1 n=1 Tax=Scutellospora calospora TaxID=85575 RepID=A0ACA9JU28_9GLOM|nr:4193_t:CDS:2 [Scutellospora calospora]
MTYATRLLTRRQTQGNNKQNDDIKSNGVKRSKAIAKNGSNKGRSLRSSVNNSLNCTKKREDIGIKKVMVADILAIKSNDNEEYALLSYKDANLIPNWQPVRNLRNATALIEKFWRNQASQTCRLVNETDSSSNMVEDIDDNLKVIQTNNDGKTDDSKDFKI